jgi:hypothetical protein
VLTHRTVNGIPAVQQRGQTAIAPLAEANFQRFEELHVFSA